MESKRITVVELVQGFKEDPNIKAIDEMVAGDCFLDQLGRLCMKMDAETSAGKRVVCLNGDRAGVGMFGLLKEKFRVLPNVRIEVK